MLRKIAVWAALVAATGALYAVETKTWVQDSQADFAKGTLNGLSLRSDGRLSLGPVFEEILDPATAYLWTIVVDSKGRIFAGGGSASGGAAKVWEIEGKNKPKAIVELPGLEIHALALDSRDRLYAATAPDGKVYRINGDKADVFYDPKAKYIWGIAFNSKGEMYVATGDTGEVHRVTPDGKGSVFFKTEETHARSLAIDAKDNLILGTEPGGLIMRISPAGEGFVLHQSAKREVTAVAVSKDGSIYAAAVGNKQPTVAGSVLSTISTAPVSTPPAAATSGAQSGARIQTAPILPPISPGPTASIAGGSEVIRIDAESYARRVWSSATEIVYALGFDAAGKTLLGTGNKGNVYRLDSDTLSTLLLSAAPTQITGFFAGRNGGVYAVTGNAGKAYRIGPEIMTKGTFESEVLDAGSFCYWGRLSYNGQGGVAVETRSGNLDRPQKNWSAWSPTPLARTGGGVTAGGRIASPPARFVQYRLTLTAGQVAPHVASVELAHQPKNVAPAITLVELTPANYRYPATSLPVTPSTNLTLPAIGQRRTTSAAVSLDTPATLNYAKGYMSARWSASDNNGDALQFKVEIRGVAEKQWKLLKDKTRDRHVSWDATAFPDGEYRLRITASDEPDNPPGEALQAELESDVFVIDNTPPRITGLAASATGNKITVRWNAADTGVFLNRTEYSVNGSDWLVVEPTTRLTDSPEHDYELTIDKPAGEATIAVRVTDDYDNQTVEKVVVKQ